MRWTRRQWAQLAIDVTGWTVVGFSAGALVILFYVLLFATFAPR